MERTNSRIPPSPSESVMRLHGILLMAMTIPTNPLVAMNGQYVANGEKVYSVFHHWPSVVHRRKTSGQRWKTSGHRWKLTFFEVITWYVAHLNAENGKFCLHFSRKFYSNVYWKSNYAIKSAKLQRFWRYGCWISFKRRSTLIEENISRFKALQKVDLEKSVWNVILLSSKSQFERTTSTQNFHLVEPNIVTLLVSDWIFLIQVCRRLSCPP